MINNGCKIMGTMGVFSVWELDVLIFATNVWFPWLANWKMEEKNIYYGLDDTW